MSYWERERFLNFTLARRNDGVHDINRRLWRKPPSHSNADVTPRLSFAAVESSAFTAQIYGFTTSCLIVTCPVYFPAVLFMSHGMLLAVIYKCQNHFQSVPFDLVPCSASSFQLCGILLWLACWHCGQTVQRTGLSQHCGMVLSPPPHNTHTHTYTHTPHPGTPIATSRYFTPACWLGWALHLFWGQLCFYNPPVAMGFPRNPHLHLAILWLSCYYNSEYKKQPIYQSPSMNICVPSFSNTLRTCGWNLRTEGSCDYNKQMCFRQPRVTWKPWRPCLCTTSCWYSMTWLTRQFVILTNKTALKVARKLRTVIYLGV